MKRILSLKSLKGVRATAAFSIVETLFSLGIGAVALSGAMMVNSQQLRLVKSTRDSSAASHSIEERVEQLRTATWRQITDSTYVSDTLFATLPKSIAPLDSYYERITVTPWPDSSVAQSLIVEKRPNSSARIVSQGSGLSDQRLAKIDVQIQWSGKEGRIRTRELTTIISNGGISRMNLPAMGPLGGGTWDSTSQTSGGSSPTPTPTPTQTGNNGNGNGNGNGSDNGRGNVGGKQGTK